jgi:hypothetical protein
MPDWIRVAEACRLVPSPHAGKRTATQTIVRWILRGRIEGKRSGRYWLVRRDQVLGCLRPDRASQPEVQARRQRERSGAAWAAQVLREMGVVRD